MDVTLSKKLASLSVLSQKKLENILSKCGEKKDFIIEPSLIEPFGKICGASWLRQNGVDKIYKLEPNNGAANNANKVYLIPSCLIKLKHVLDQISGMISQNIIGEKTLINVIMVPQVMVEYELLLEEEGLCDVVNLRSFQWELIEIDEGILSLEIPNTFKEVFVYKNTSLLNSVSNTLWTLFHVVGKPSLFVSLGKFSANVIEMYDIYCETYNKGIPCKTDSDFGGLLVVDRDQDYASSLLTPATYSGLIYEIFNVKCGKVTLDAVNTKYKAGKLNLVEGIIQKKEEENVKESAKAESSTAVMHLNSEIDDIFSNIRYRHFSTVFSILSAKAKALNSEGSNISDLQLNQMKQYVSTKLQGVISLKKNLANHLLACETIVSTFGDKFEDVQIAESSMLLNRSKKSNFNFVEQNICIHPHLYASLRYLCLLSLTQGLTTEEYSGYINKYLHAFGFKYMYVFHNLVNGGLIIPPIGGKLQMGIPNLAAISERLPKWQTNFQIAANKLKQLPNESQETNVKDPGCPSYVFNGSYIPLIAIASKMLLTCENSTDLITKLSSFNDVKIGGPVFENCRTNVDELGEKLSKANLDNLACPKDLDIACKDLKTAGNLFKNDNVKYSVLPLRPKSLLVYVIGGVTQAEIAACHLVEKLTGGRIVIASDSITSGDAIIRASM